ncbi:MAG: pyruvate kinase [Parcubacteria group bacterium Gr01-1014_46]|nr:MAG: pyruvate kinase [Parcubacteria group bacterium Gr01-1014_46]
MNTGKLIIARHQESEWNKLGKWTGTRDRHLTDRGFEKSEDMGLLIKDINIDYAFASMQVRTIETLSCMLNVCNTLNVPTEHSSALNERDYGDYTGKDKEDMRKMLGEEEYNKMHRGWDYPVPNGESLKDVSERVVPFFIEKILPKIKEGKNVLVVGHGNSMRTLVKYIENISDEEIVNVEVPFEKVFVYDLDENGHMVKKGVKEAKSDTPSQIISRTQILATIGPSSIDREILKNMLSGNVDAVRFNFSWLDKEKGGEYFDLVKEISKELDREIIIIADLPGPRIKYEEGHSYDHNTPSGLTEVDKELIKFTVQKGVDYIALSFVSSKKEIEMCREIISQNSGRQKIIAKIERQVAVDNIHEIVEFSDAIMVARGDLGQEIPFEKIPFIQSEIIKKCKAVNKPVIVATQMLFSMVENEKPTRAEVTDVSSAVLEGADVLMLSDETAIGKYPIEAVKVMERIILEAEQHTNALHVNAL